MRQRAWVGGLCLGLALGVLSPPPAEGFIERDLPLKKLMDDSDYIFAAKVVSIDRDRSAMVVTAEKDLKGKTPHRRMAINLTGDKEKHTPHLLKRVAPDLPLVVFLTELEGRHEALAYTNGTWFQVIGYPDGPNVRWAFTHCEIYLRRTFKGTTAELQQIISDVLAGKAKPPPHNPKEPAGFGPELEQQPAAPRQGSAGGGGPLFGVIALPFLAPLAALLQLLFPGLLREQWWNYRIAISVLLTQTTLLFVHFALVRWVVSEWTWWLGDDVLWGVLTAVALVGVLAALAGRLGRSRALPVRQQREPADSPFLPSHQASHTASAGGKPVRVEFYAFGILAFAGLVWASYLLYQNRPPFDHMAVVTAAALLGTAHLVYRRVRCTAAARGGLVTTQLVFLAGLALAGTVLGAYLHMPAGPNREAAPVRAEWSAFRGGPDRTGSADPQDAGPTRPAILWQFDATPRKGRISLHSSPAVVDGQVYIGALYEVLSSIQGYVYCVNAEDGRLLQDQPVRAGERIWAFDAKSSLKPVFSSPTVVQGRLYVGEGYHQDQACRLFCLDARSGDRVLWAKRTGSHVESSPVVVGNRVYFGAGDDGVYCVDADDLEEPAAPGEPKSPTTLWRVDRVHVDGSPLVVGNRLFAGSIVGDRYQDLYAFAVDTDTGKVVWRVPAPLPVCSSPAFADGRVFFGLGNGKVNEEAERPQGAVWALDAATGQRLWEFRTAQAVFGTPALADGRLYVTARDGHCYCLHQHDGTLAWKQPLDAAVIASPVVAGGKVYVVSVTGALYCLDAGTGRVIWRFDELKLHAPDADVYSSPALVKGRLYLAVGSKLFCIGDR